jgi:hypothetical protein
MKKRPLLAAAVLACLLPMVASAASPGCVNARRGYEARTIGTREVMIRNTLGEHRTELKLTTTCVNMNRDDAVRIDALSTCVTTGDRVFVSVLGGGHQACRVTGVGPYDSGQPWDAHR